MLIPASMLAIFAGYLYLLTGSWTAWYTAQKTGWVREFTWPWDSFCNTISAVLPGAYADHPWWAAVFRAEMCRMFVGVGVVIWCLVVSCGPGVPASARCGPRPAGWASRCWRSPSPIGSSRSTGPPCSGSRCGS